MTVESEQVLEDNSIVIMLNVRGNSMEVISIEDLIDICAEYSGPYYYVTEMIPPKN